MLQFFSEGRNVKVRQVGDLQLFFVSPERLLNHGFPAPVKRRRTANYENLLGAWSESYCRIDGFGWVIHKPCTGKIAAKFPKIIELRTCAAKNDWNMGEELLVGLHH